ncbi:MULTISPECIES: hypothetical protein [Rhodococcus]|uniref:hypothetical protein n=1 Tax=Rhodococcus TaxID=1827 RepID=UPI000AE53B94|nr:MULTISPECIES: hypothetical protein [Rhodococcus]WAL49707.1 hypothetical protein OQN32_27230 [Rhodococcus pyridinivorans]
MTSYPAPKRPAHPDPPVPSGTDQQDSLESSSTDPARPDISEATDRESGAAEAGRRTKKRKTATTDILLSIDVELKERMVATLLHTQASTGITSQQQFIRVAIDQLCSRIERDYNSGKPFAPPAEGINL